MQRDEESSVDWGSIVAFFLVVGGLALWVTAAALVNGFVVSTLWGWFVVPLFQAPSLTVAQAIGILLVATAFRGVTAPTHKRKGKEQLEVVVASFVFPLAGLAIGWIVRSFI